jgi:hypothetical protein
MRQPQDALMLLIWHWLLEGAQRMRQPVLTPAQQRRLVKLAREAGRTPQSMLRFVLRDGFERCEENVQAARMANAELARSGTVSHQQVMDEARATIACHVRAQRRQVA